MTLTEKQHQEWKKDLIELHKLRQIIAKCECTNNRDALLEVCEKVLSDYSQGQCDLSTTRLIELEQAITEAKGQTP